MDGYSYWTKHGEVHDMPEESQGSSGNEMSMQNYHNEMVDAEMAAGDTRMEDEMLVSQDG
jgi:hypothetical protein